MVLDIILCFQCVPYGLLYSPMFMATYGHGLNCTGIEIYQETPMISNILCFPRENKGISVCRCSKSLILQGKWVIDITIGLLRKR